MTTPFFRTRAVRALAPLLASVLAFSLSSCGSSDDVADEGGLTKIRVASAGKIPAFEDVIWGIEGGFFEKRGLEVEMTPPLYATDALNAVLNGDAEVSLSTATLVVGARAAGRPLKVVATNQAPFPLEFAFTEEVDKKLRDQGLSETSDIADFFEALEGLTLGTTTVGSSINSTFRYLLAEEGLDPEKDNITLQTMPDIPAQIAALSNKKVDGLISALGGATTGATAQGVGVLWDVSKMAGNEAMQAVPYVNVVTSDSIIEENPEAIQSFLEGLREAQTSLRDGISVEEHAALKEIAGAEMDQTVYDNTTQRGRALFQDDFVSSEDMWEAVVKVAQVASDVPLEVSFEDAVDNSFAEKIQ